MESLGPVLEIRPDPRTIDKIAVLFCQELVNFRKNKKHLDKAEKPNNHRLEGRWLFGFNKV